MSDLTLEITRFAALIFSIIPVYPSAFGLFLFLEGNYRPSMCFGWDLALVLNHPQRPGLALLLCSPQPLHDSLGSTKVVNLGGTNGTLKGKRFLISVDPRSLKCGRPEQDVICDGPSRQTLVMH